MKFPTKLQIMHHFPQKEIMHGIINQSYKLQDN